MSVCFLDLPDRDLRIKTIDPFTSRKTFWRQYIFGTMLIESACSQWRIQDSPSVVAPTLQGRQHYDFAKLSKKTTWNWNHFGPFGGRGGGAPWVLPLNPPLVLHNLSAAGFHCFHHHGLPRLKQRKRSIFFQKELGKIMSFLRQILIHGYWVFAYNI